MRKKDTKKFIIKSTGCSRRNIDAEKICNYLTANGLERTAYAEEADHMIVVTCGLTKDFTKQSLEIISDFKKHKGEILVYGCLPAMDPKSIASVHNGKILLTKDIEKLNDIFDLPIRFEDVDDANKAFWLWANPGKMEKKLASTKIGSAILKIMKKATRRLALFLEKYKKSFIEGLSTGIGFDNRFFTLQISRGCSGNCSYCTIKKALGKLKSKPTQVILKELKKALSKKQYRINISSSDSGSYGLDIGSNLPQLLNAILNEDKRIVIEFIQDLNPAWICRYKEKMAELIKTKRIKSILTPVQSGNERILKLMNRPLDLKEFKQTINRMKQACSHLKLRTQVIVGFPTETEEEFEDTVTFLKQCPFDEVDIFAYYEVGGSTAEKITPKVPPDIIVKRAKKLAKTLTVPYRLSTNQDNLETSRKFRLFARPIKS